MSVKISTKQQLDSNFYNSLTVREVDGNFFVKVSGNKSNGDYVITSLKLSDNFKGITDDKKIICIVDSFLENATIDSIEVDAFHVGYGGKFIKVSGTRTLYLQLDNKELLKVIISMIKNKYNRDRYKGIIGSDDSLYNISLSEKTSSYGKEFVSCEDCCEDCSNDYCPKPMTFKLMYVNGKIVGFDKKFIERFIYDRLWEFGCKAILVEETKPIKLVGGIVIGNSIKAYSVVCGNLEIRFECSVFTKDYVCSFCNGIVDKYNNELDKELLQINSYKKRQLKMEGF